jgi:hypothetical protein
MLLLRIGLPQEIDGINGSLPGSFLLMVFSFG